jgi:hypothetical protein
VETRTGLDPLQLNSTGEEPVSYIGGYFHIVRNYQNTVTYN